MKIACIFDLDGVIVDTAKYHFLAWRRLANSLGFDFTEHDNEQLKGVSRVESLKLILRLGDKHLSEDEFQSALAIKNEWYLEHIQKIGPEEILPGAAEFVSSVRQLGIKVALGSASKNALLILKRIQMIDQFDAIIDGNVVSQAKPDPEVFLQAAMALQVVPEQCVVFEDALAGVHAALNAKMKVIGIGTKDVLHEAHFVMPNFLNTTIDDIIKKFPEYS